MCGVIISRGGNSEGHSVTTNRVHDVLPVAFSDIQRQNVKLKTVKSQRKKKRKAQNWVTVN